MPNIYAQWDAGAKILRIRDDVYISMQSHETRSRFTFFHEVQHILFNHQGIRNRMPDVKIDDLASRQAKQAESEANRATSVFMAPRYLVGSDTSTDAIMRRFGLGRTAANFRKEEIDKFDRISRGELRELPDNVRQYLLDARDRGYKIQTKLD